MYEIYINEHHFVLTNKQGKDNFLSEKKGDVLVAKHRTKKSLFQYIDLLEKSKEEKCVLIWSEGLQKLKDDFFDLFKVVPAGGGVVHNDKGECLYIFRNGVWDLPKGKMEKGETMEETALREVQEETGLVNLKLISKLTETYHTYLNRKGKRCIKHSYWYFMETTDKELVPQAEEGIEKVLWIDPVAFKNGNYKPIYQNIILVLNEAHRLLKKE